MCSSDLEKAKEYWDRYLRLQADFENTRKRWERDKQDFIKFANEEIITSLLNIVDDLERSLHLANNKESDAFVKGIQMILTQMHDLLKKYGVIAIDARGKIFNPHFHEALMQEEIEDIPENTITEEFQKGYMIQNRVIRTAKVKVSKKKSEEVGEVDSNRNTTE